MPNSHYEVQVLRISDVIAITGLGRSSIYNKINSKSPYYDKGFPKPFKLGLRTTGWLKNDIQNWIKNVSAHQVEKETKNAEQ